MDIAIEILQQTTTPWSRTLILLLVVLLFIGRHLYTVYRRRNLEKENINEIRAALEIKKLILEIEMMEGGLQHPTPETDKNQSIQWHEGNEKIWKPMMGQKTLWPDKMIYGLLGSFFFLLVIVLFNMMVSMDAQHVDQYFYASFVKDMVISMVGGIGVALIPGTQRWDYFFYGFGLPVLLAFLIVAFKT